MEGHVAGLGDTKTKEAAPIRGMLRNVSLDEALKILYAEAALAPPIAKANLHKAISLIELALELEEEQCYKSYDGYRPFQDDTHGRIGYPMVLSSSLSWPPSGWWEAPS